MENIIFLNKRQIFLLTIQIVENELFGQTSARVDREILLWRMPVSGSEMGT